MSLKQSPIEELSVFRQVGRLYSQKHSRSITAIAIDPAGKCVVTTSEDNTAKRWRIDTGQVLNTYQHEDTVTSVQFSPSGDYILTSSMDGTGAKWDVITGDRLVDYAYHAPNTGVTSVSMRPDESTLFLGGNDSQLHRYYVSSGEYVHSLEGHDGPVTTCAMGPTGEFLYSASMDKTVKRWTLRLPIREVPACVGTYAHEDIPRSITISPSNNLFFCGSARQIVVWEISGKNVLGNLDGHEPVQVVEAHEKRVTGLATDANGAVLISCSYDGKVKEWNVESWECMNTIKIHPLPTTCAVYAKGRNILSCDAGGVMLRSLGQGKNGSDDALTEDVLAKYTNVPRANVYMTILAVIVQYLQLMAFAFSFRFQWNDIINWLQVVVSPLKLSVLEFTQDLSEEADLALAISKYVAAGWAVLTLLLFITNLYSVNQRYKGKLQRELRGITVEYKYQAPGESKYTALGEADEDIPSKAKWQRRETATYKYRASDAASAGLWFFFWFTMSFLAIPLIGTLALAAAFPIELYEQIVAIVLLSCFSVVYIAVKASGGSISNLTNVRDSSSNYVFWLFELAGRGEKSLQGPLTAAAWQVDFVATLVTIAFAIVNNVLGPSSENTFIIACTNVGLAGVILSSVLLFRGFDSYKARAVLVGLQTLQCWNMAIALYVAVLNDSEDVTPAIIWYVGGFLVTGLATLCYFKLAERAIRKSQRLRNDSVKLVSSV